jgi:hypothetical protein
MYPEFQKQILKLNRRPHPRNVQEDAQISALGPVVKEGGKGIKFERK